MNAPKKSVYPDDEVDLFELWLILVKRKVLVFVCILFCLTGGAAYALLKAPVYEASVMLRIGQVRGDSGGAVVQLDNAEELSARLFAQYGENLAEGIKRSRPFITKVTVQKGVATTLQLTAEGDTPEDAARILQEVVARVEKDHAALYADNIKPIASRLRSLDEQRQVLQRQYADITTLSEQLKRVAPVQASLLIIERGPIAIAINEQDAERLRLSQQLTPPQTRPTEVLGEITAPSKPSRPKKSLVLALTAVLGLLLGLVLVFSVEFFTRARRNAAGPPDRSSLQAAPD